MPDIEFTQYLAPTGRKASVRIDRPEPVHAKAQEIAGKGFRFEVEILSTGDVSLTIADDDGDHAIEVVPNGPEVPAAVDRMILGFQIPTAPTTAVLAQWPGGIGELPEF